MPPSIISDHGSPSEEEEALPVIPEVESGHDVMGKAGPEKEPSVQDGRFNSDSD